ncbi:hypothetical protein BD410DRAFT_780030 [Rickenella mellea]|uniref:Gfd2/YDR514C-like C-terminal domain-containing protein n=1 Tax=Rickenella mellea TaxID=50990 RepID=A0A4R5XFM4_9AGAM|nr:hypothetical protein BD410DRAFT_780030 [Rickenella mellea]
MPTSSPIITGFYRYTDILWEWHQVISDPAEVSALKAFISNASLVDPKNPLRKAGADGIELYVGTLSATGQARLLYSSAQVEYIRYWLHAMGLTKELLPMPSSESLLTTSNLRNHTPVIYKTAEDLKKAVKMIDKNNKRLKGTDPALMSMRQSFERVRTFWGAKVGTWLAIDFEAWEREHTVLTEFGWSCIQWKDGEEICEEGHLMVKEHASYRNGTYVPDHREHYEFGLSQIVDKITFKRMICDMINGFADQGPLFLVFHDGSQDIKYLNSASITAPLNGLTYLLPESAPDTGLYVVDTSDMFAAMEGYAGERSAFVRMANLLKIPTAYLHNAGNDAHYTLLAMKAMASGNQLDVQREERWPHHNKGDVITPGSALKVQFNAWEEEEDYSDTEGVMASSIPHHEVEVATKLMSIDDEEIKDEEMLW